MNKYLGNIFGINHFENDFVPIGKIYPNGKKDGNRLGKRKRNQEYSGFVYYNHPNPAKNCMIIHPSKVNDLLEIFKHETSN